MNQVARTLLLAGIPAALALGGAAQAQAASTSDIGSYTAPATPLRVLVPYGGADTIVFRGAEIPVEFMPCFDLGINVTANQTIGTTDYVITNKYTGRDTDVQPDERVRLTVVAPGKGCETGVPLTDWSADLPDGVDEARADGTWATTIAPASGHVWVEARSRTHALEGPNSVTLASVVMRGADANSTPPAGTGPAAEIGRSGSQTQAPTSVPPTSIRPTSVPPTSVRPTSVPAPTSVPVVVLPTSVVPTSVRPTSVRPTSVPPTSVRPTSIPPTSVPGGAGYGYGYGYGYGRASNNFLGTGLSTQTVAAAAPAGLLLIGASLWERRRKKSRLSFTA
jgi:hypothetical protein